MNNEHPIDKLFKQQLGQSSADVPNDMWDRIAAQRSQNRKPKFFWMWSSLGVLIVGLAVYLLLPDATSSPQLSFFQVEQTDKAAAQVGTIQQIEDVSSVETQQRTESQNKQTKTVAAKAKSTRKLNGAVKTNKSRYTTKYRKADKGTQVESSLSLLDEATKNNEIIAEQIETEVVSSTQNEELEEGRILGPHQRSNRYVTATIPALLFTLPSQETMKLFSRSATRCARFENPFFHLDLEILSGPAYAQQQLTARTSESDAHLQKRKESESPSLSYTTGLRLAATSRSGLGLKTGLIYSQINDRFKYLVGSRLETVVIRDPNDNIIRIDTNFIKAYTAERKNKLKFLEIPVLVGFETRAGKLRVGVNAGAYLQLFFDAKGEIFSPATEERVTFGQRGEDGVLPIFGKRASAAWYIGTSFTYNLHSKYSITAEPYFKTFPRALSVPDYDLQQNYWTVGIQLGMRMRL